MNMVVNIGIESLLDHLAAALAEERRAILEHDVEALIRSTHEKLECLRQVEVAVRDTDATLIKTRLSELAQANQANGALLARRRREVNWTLRHLGRSETAGAYDIHGQTSRISATRALGVV